MKQEDRWRAHEDMRTLHQAAEIAGDPKRLANVHAIAAATKHVAKKLGR